MELGRFLLKIYEDRLKYKGYRMRMESYYDIRPKWSGQNTREE